MPLLSPHSTLMGFDPISFATWKWSLKNFVLYQEILQWILNWETKLWFQLPIRFCLVSFQKKTQSSLQWLRGPREHQRPRYLREPHVRPQHPAHRHHGQRDRVHSQHSVHSCIAAASSRGNNCRVKASKELEAPLNPTLSGRVNEVIAPWLSRASHACWASKLLKQWARQSACSF